MAAGSEPAARSAVARQPAAAARERRAARATGGRARGTGALAGFARASLALPPIRAVCTVGCHRDAGEDRARVVATPRARPARRARATVRAAGRVVEARPAHAVLAAFVVAAASARGIGSVGVAIAPRRRGARVARFSGAFVCGTGWRRRARRRRFRGPVGRLSAGDDDEHEEEGMDLAHGARHGQQRCRAPIPRSSRLEARVGAPVRVNVALRASVRTRSRGALRA